MKSSNNSYTSTQNLSPIARSVLGLRANQFFDLWHTHSHIHTPHIFSKSLFWTSHIILSILTWISRIFVLHVRYQNIVGKCGRCQDVGKMSEICRVRSVKFVGCYRTVSGRWVFFENLFSAFSEVFRNIVERSGRHRDVGKISDIFRDVRSVSGRRKNVRNLPGSPVSIRTQEKCRKFFGRFPRDKNLSGYSFGVET